MDFIDYWIKYNNDNNPPKTHNLVYLAERSNLDLDDDQLKLVPEPKTRKAVIPGSTFFVESRNLGTTIVKSLRIIDSGIPKKRVTGMTLLSCFRLDST